VPLSNDPEKRSRQLANLRPVTASLQHGAQSKVLLAPLKAEAARWARDRWPWLDDTRLALIATLAARIRRVEMWCDENDIIAARNRHTIRCQPVVAECDRWEARLEVLIRQLDVEGLARRQADAEVTFEQVMSECAQDAKAH